MLPPSKTFVRLIFALLLGCGPAKAAAMGSDEVSSPPKELRHLVQDWLSQGERQDFPWKVRLSKPVLTYQQRGRVGVEVEISAKLLQRKSISRDLHFLVKVADEKGQWLKGEVYTHYPVVTAFDKKVDLQFEAELLLQPGSFTVAAIVYDGVLGERNLSLTHVLVSAPANDPLPELLRGQPKAEFPGSPAGERFLSGTQVSLPVTTHRTVQLDLLVNLSTQEFAERDVGRRPLQRRGMRISTPMSRDASRGTQQGDFAIPRNQGPLALIQAASVLGQLRLDRGCMRVTALDAETGRTFLPATPAPDVDWQATKEAFLTTLIKVSAGELEGRLNAASTFAKQLEKLLSPQTACVPDSTHPLHVLIILSPAVPFSGARSKAILNPPKCDCKVIYLRQIDDTQTDSDELHHMLSPVTPILLKFRDPADFRRSLFDLMQVIQKLSAET